MGADAARGGLVIGLLGPVEIGSAGGTMTPVAQPRLRVLLGLLTVAAGRLVTAEALVDGVWGEQWSPGREKNLHTLVYQLRRRLAGLEPGQGAERLVRAGTGYRLVLGPGELGVAVFRDLAGQGREAARAGDPAGARELFGQALGCGGGRRWRTRRRCAGGWPGRRPGWRSSGSGLSRSGSELTWRWAGMGRWPGSWPCWRSSSRCGSGWPPC